MKFFSLILTFAFCNTCWGSAAAPSFQPSSWLEQVPDDLLVSRIPILPGSHNSGTAFARRAGALLFSLARQQKLSIAEQLNAGIRVLDLRIRFDTQQSRLRGWLGYKDHDECSPVLRIVHTLDTSYTLDESLAEVKSFLEENEQEFVVILLRGDWPPSSSFSDDKCKAGRVSFLARVLQTSGIQFARNLNKDATTVRDLRGKGVIVSQWFHEGVASMDIVPYIKWEDHYQICDIWDDATKELPGLKIDRFMQSTPERNVGHEVSLAEEEMGIPEGSRPRVCWNLPGTKTFTGVGLDRTHAYIIPPSITSPSWNEWFLINLETNPLWRPQLNPAVPVGIVLIDFADQDTVGRLIEVGLNMIPHLAPSYRA